MWYSAVQYNTVWYSTVQYNTVGYSAVQGQTQDTRHVRGTAGVNWIWLQTIKTSHIISPITIGVYHNMLNPRLWLKMDHRVYNVCKTDKYITPPILVQKVLACGNLYTHWGSIKIPHHQLIHSKLISAYCLFLKTSLTYTGCTVKPQHKQKIHISHH